MIMPAKLGGLGCPLLEESRQCNSQGCANPLMAAASAAAEQDAADTAKTKQETEDAEAAQEDLVRIVEASECCADVCVVNPGESVATSGRCSSSGTAASR